MPKDYTKIETESFDKEWLKRIQGTDVFAPMTIKNCSTETTKTFTINTNLVNYTTKQGLVNLLIALGYLSRANLYTQRTRVDRADGFSVITYLEKVETYDENKPCDSS